MEQNSNQQRILLYGWSNKSIRKKSKKRARGKKADYLLKSKHGEIPLAVIEAKDLTQSVGAGMQQAIEYAQILDIPFAYSSNGNGFLEHDFFTGRRKNSN